MATVNEFYTSCPSNNCEISTSPRVTHAATEKGRQTHYGVVAMCCP